MYGRGTYGGGKFNTVEAIKEIKNHDLSYAIFGQAYAIEANHGTHDPSIQALNGRKLWLGEKYQLLADSFGVAGSNETVETAKSQWNMDPKEWEVTNHHEKGIISVSGHNWSMKKLRMPLDSVDREVCNSVVFSMLYKGTPPNCADHFKVSVTFLDIDGKWLNEVDKTERTAGEIWQLYKQEYELPPSAVEVNVLIAGTDAENWGGFYGTAFCCETLAVKLKTKREDGMASIIGIKPAQLKEQLNTTFNEGRGAEYSINGEMIWTNPYCNLAEYNIPMFWTDNVYHRIDGTEAYQGFSCIQLDFLQEGATFELPQPIKKAPINLYDFKAVFKLPKDNEGKDRSSQGVTLSLKFSDHPEDTIDILSRELKSMGMLRSLNNGWIECEMRALEINTVDYFKLSSSH